MRQHVQMEKSASELRPSSLATKRERRERDDKLGTGGTVKDFTLIIRNKFNGREWTERYQRATNDPQEWGRVLITWFNSTLRPGEAEREFVKVIVHGDVPPPKHSWTKTALMTQQGVNGRMFDPMKCKRCGITAKRYGIGAPSTIDRKFRAKVYNRCDTTMMHLEKKKHERE